MDHREIGQQLDLFMFHPLSPGCPIWLPHGNTVYSILSDKIRRLNVNNGYVEVRTPVLWKPELYNISGHMEHYAENMFFTMGQGEQDTCGEGGYVLKPMNCPGHMLIFKSKTRSYADLPLRIHDQGILHRNEVSGAIGGLTRCRAFCQDDGHVFVAGTGKSIEEEVTSIMWMIEKIYKKLDMPIRLVLATRPEKFMGSLATWEIAEKALFTSIMRTGLGFSSEKGGAFYGPKIDFFVKDSQDREWQTATIQLDFQLPEKFDLKYKGGTVDGQQIECQPVVIHRAMYGSFERFIGILLEHYEGRLPLWLAPVQCIILPIADRHHGFAAKVAEGMKQPDCGCDEPIRYEIDKSNNTLSHKIALAQTRKIPFMVVLGDKEEKSNTVNVRPSVGKTFELSTTDFIENVRNDMKMEF